MASVRLSELRELLSELEIAAPPDTFERVYLDDIRPQLQQQIGFEYFEELERSVARFRLWRGACTPLAEIQEGLVVQFEAWLQERCGFGDRTTRKNGRALRRVIRCVDENRCRPAKWQRTLGADDAAEPGTLRHFFDTIYKPRRLLAKSPNTLRLYVNTMRNFQRYLGHPPMVSDLCEQTLTGFMGWHVERGNGPHTANKDVGQLMSMARYAFKKRLLETEPEILLLRAPSRAPLGWMLEELAKLFKAIDRIPGAVDGIPAKCWWKALMLTIYYSGERIAALLQLEWQHVDLASATLLIPAELRKGKRQDKLFPLGQVAVDALKAIHQRDNKHVFPWPRSLSTLYGQLKIIHRRAGLPTDRRSMFHRMRRTTASWFKRAGGDPSILLDHADPKTTRRYLDLRICGGPSAALLLADPTLPVAVEGGGA